MASSGTFTSGRYGNSSWGPWLTLAWSQVSQSVANNTTTLDLTLRFHWSANINYIFHSRTGTLQGNSYTYSGSASGTSGSRVLKTQRVTITHNSNGAKSVTLSGNITGLGLTYSGNRINTMSVSGTANLNTIPRASTLSAFSFNANLKNGTANQINYTIDRKSSGFRHQIQLRDGNTTVKQWDNIDSNGASTLPLTATEVNTLLNRMASSTTKSYTLRVATRSGNNGGWIGSAVSRNATATVHADVKPTVSAVTLSQTGNPVSSHTLQGFSKIKASFTRSAGYGATISSSSIQVRRRSGGADSQTINSNDGTTSNSVALNGVYEARGTARDSRGRTTNTAWATITVTPYSAPTITNFSAVRNGSTPERVDISRTTTHTVLGTSNHLTYTIQRRQGTGAWTNVNTGATGTVTTSGATGSATSTGNSVTQSYEFRLVVQDKLGGKAESIQTVSTQRVVLDIHKNEGVGIGKVHEQGVLDVSGAFYLNGKEFGSSTAWADITGKPSTFAPSSHNHSGNNITSGTVPYARLPVGTGSSQVARGNHTHNYLPTSGGTVKGNLLVTGQGRMGNGKLNVENKGSYNIHIDNSAGQYGEVTMRPSAHNHGNVGSLKYSFDSSAIKTMTNGSNRETKTDIKPYDESVAYEELRDIPIYTFKYKEGQYENYHIGSMMDYMPLDIIDTGATADGDKPNAWTHDSTIWFNMAVSKELQKKVENLEEKNLELEIKLNELEEKLQWL